MTPTVPKAATGIFTQPPGVQPQPKYSQTQPDKHTQQNQNSAAYVHPVAENALTIINLLIILNGQTQSQKKRIGTERY